MDADVRRRAVVDRDEYRRLAVLDGEGRGHVGSPDRIDDLGDDRAVVAAQAAEAARPGGRREAVLAHQPAHALLRGAQPCMAQPRPHFAVALAVKRAARENLTDRLNEVDVGHRPHRPLPDRGAAGAIAARRPR